MWALQYLGKQELVCFMQITEAYPLTCSGAKLIIHTEPLLSLTGKTGAIDLILL